MYLTVSGDHSLTAQAMTSSPHAMAKYWPDMSKDTLEMDPDGVPRGRCVHDRRRQNKCDECGDGQIDS